MKKIIFFLLILSFLLTSCGGKAPAYPLGGSGSNLYETLQERPSADGGESAYDYVKKVYNARTHAVYGDVAIVQLKAESDAFEEDKIVALSSTENKVTPLFNGTIVGLFDSILVAVDQQGYHALNLNQGTEWVHFAPETLHYQTIRNGKELYLFSFAGEGEALHTKVWTLNLETLTASGMDLSFPCPYVEMVGGTLYFIDQNGALSAADPATRAAKVAYTPEKSKLDSLTASGTGLLIKNNLKTLLYNTKNGEITELDVRAAETKGTLLRAIGTDNTVRYYDNQTWQETTPTVNFDSWFPLSDGFYTYDPNRFNYSPDCEASVTVGDNTYTLPYQTAPLELVANDQCGVFEQEGYVAVVDWESGKQQIYKNEALLS